MHVGNYVAMHAEQWYSLQALSHAAGAFSLGNRNFNAHI